jgi:dihydroorotase
MDVAVNAGRIAAIEPDIPADSAFEVIEAGGLMITPGLVDMHAHVFSGVGYFSIDPEPIASQSGVTTWVDAGSVGAATLAGFRKYVADVSCLTIRAFVNIAYTGLVSQNYELSVDELCNVDLLKRVVNRNRDLVVGIKLRAGMSGGAVGLIPYERTRKAADELELPIMVHISTAPPDLPTVLRFLKRGDIITHAFTGQNMRLIDEKGKILPEAKRAIENGIVLDLGHGAGSLSFDTAEAMFAQGYWPNVVSTDLHWMSIYGSGLILDDPGRGLVLTGTQSTDDAGSVMVRIREGSTPTFNLLTCIDKMLCLGMPFAEVIQRTTARPAEILRLSGEVGTLKPGARADIAALTVDKADIELRDIHGQVRHGTQSVHNHWTLLGGRMLERKSVAAPPPWVQFIPV